MQYKLSFIDYFNSCYNRQHGVGTASYHVNLSYFGLACQSRRAREAVAADLSLVFHYFGCQSIWSFGSGATRDFLNWRHAWRCFGRTVIAFVPYFHCGSTSGTRRRLSWRKIRSALGQFRHIITIYPVSRRCGSQILPLEFSLLCMGLLRLLALQLCRKRMNRTPRGEWTSAKPSQA